MLAEIHQSDIGTAFRYRVLDESDNVVAISGCTLQVVFLAPNGLRLVRTPNLFTDGSDGKMQYVTASGDLSVAGIWKTQAIVQNDTQTLNSNVQTFKVFPNI